jgi:hypothetical protein
VEETVFLPGQFTVVAQEVVAAAAAALTMVLILVLELLDKEIMVALVLTAPLEALIIQAVVVVERVRLAAIQAELLHLLDKAVLVFFHQLPDHLFNMPVEVGVEFITHRADCHRLLAAVAEEVAETVQPLPELIFHQLMV